MKFLNNRKGAVTFLLTALLLISCFLIIRLELRAASFQSRLDEHHNELMDNSDILTQLKSFWRKVQNSFIVVDEKMVWLGSAKSSLMMKGNEFNINMSSGKLNLELSESKKLVQLMNGNSKLSLYQDNIEIEAKDFSFYIDTKINDLLISYKNQIIFHIDADKKSLTLQYEKLDFLSDNMTINTKENIEILAKGDIRIGPTGKTIGYSKNGDFIYMENGESQIYLGKLTGNISGKGISLQGKMNGPMLSVSENMILLETPDSKYKLFIDPANQLVGMKQGQSQITIKNDKIEIEALGDINITSKNGKVYINGKR